MEIFQENLQSLFFLLPQIVVRLNLDLRRIVMDFFILSLHNINKIVFKQRIWDLTPRVDSRSIIQKKLEFLLRPSKFIRLFSFAFFPSEIYVMYKDGINKHFSSSVHWNSSYVVKENLLRVG